MDRRQVLRLIGGLAAAGLTGAAAACSTDSVGPAVPMANGKQITIGLVAPAVGGYARVGDEITKGFQLYLNEHNKLLGRYAVTVETVDEGANVADGTRAVKSLLDKQVMAIAGVANPQVLSATVTLAAAAKIPILSANAAPGSLGASDFIWRVSSLQGEAGQAAATFARQEGKRAYLLYDTNPMNQAEADGFQRGFTDLGGTIAGQSVGSDGLGARLSDALDTNPNIIFAAYSGDTATALLSVYRTNGTQVKLVGPGALTETADLSKLPTLPKRVFTTMFYAPDLENTENQRFVASYHNQHGAAPSSAAAAAYDTAGLLDRALALLPDDADAAKVNDALGVLGRIDTPRGTWTFNTARSPQQTWYLRELRLDGTVAANLLDSDLVVLS